MGIEIERKFLVNYDLLKPFLVNGIPFEQGYIPTKDFTTVRVRIAGDKAFMTIKGQSTGFSRAEFEYEIPVVDAREILDSLCGNHIIKKRFLIQYENHTFEVDEFYGENSGLIVAEVELNSESESVTLPRWIESEVTGDHRYSNSSLAVTPFSKW